MKEIERKKENIVKGISTEDFSGELFWEIVQQFTSEGPMNCFGRLSNIFASEGSLICLPNLSSKFSRTKSFCFENRVFTRIWLRHV